MKREALIRHSKRIVIKVGSSLLFEGLQFRNERFESLAASVSWLLDQGKEVVLVTSGAVACGMIALGDSVRKSQDIPFKQALSSVGQSILMRFYLEAFSKYGRKVGQILLAPEDVHYRRKYLNARNTIETLLNLGVVPVVNENDTVAVDEIKFGDNDRLSALVSALIDAHLLVILSDVEGLFTRDPRLFKDATLVKEVFSIDENIEAMAGGEGSHFSTGGMKSKIMAARMATLSGTAVIIASGRDFGIIKDIFLAREVGTFFYPQKRGIRSRKRWIAFGMLPGGKVFIDEGAKKALNEGKSLLPPGVIGIEGDFEVGECVEIFDATHKRIGRGLVNYSSEELKIISGLRTHQVRKVLQRENLEEEVIHADNLILLEEEEKDG
ncbi:glutamate 5-kinase [Thermatribacter velox]|uniref:Glutamate 5-kinase n=1 Tax=Thermatribacter velox TaxID=3039681 RepID=A0ABZ2YEA3_9BACT